MSSSTLRLYCHLLGLWGSLYFPFPIFPFSHFPIPHSPIDSSMLGSSLKITSLGWKTSTARSLFSSELRHIPCISHFPFPIPHSSFLVPDPSPQSQSLIPAPSPSPSHLTINLHYFLSSFAIQILTCTKLTPSTF